MIARETKIAREEDRQTEEEAERQRQRNMDIGEAFFWIIGDQFLLVFDFNMRFNVSLRGLFVLYLPFPREKNKEE